MVAGCGKKQSEDDAAKPRHSAAEICARLEKKSYAKNCKKSSALPAGVAAATVADFFTFDATFFGGSKTYPGTVTAFTSKTAEANRRFSIAADKQFQAGAGHVLVHVTSPQKIGDPGYEAVAKNVNDMLE